MLFCIELGIGLYVADIAVEIRVWSLGRHLMDAIVLWKNAIRFGRLLSIRSNTF